MPDIIATYLWYGAAASLALVALVALVAILTRVAGYAWTRGVQSAHRTHRRDNPPPCPDPTVDPAGPDGAVCVVGHYIEPGPRYCPMGHKVNDRRTRTLRPDELRDLGRNWHRRQAEDAREMDTQRLAAGGW